MKITEFPSVQVLNPDNMFLLDGPNGTRIIYAPDLAEQLLKIGGTEAITGSIKMSEMKNITSLGVLPEDAMIMFGSDEEGNVAADLDDGFFAMVEAASEDNISIKRSNYRGKNLGSVVTDEQYAAIADGTFKGLFLGDYWYIGGRHWRIMDFDYWWNTGDTPCLTHHVVIMPDECLYSKAISETNSTAGGYNMASWVVLDAITIIKGAFTDEHVLSHRELFCNDVTNGYPSSGAWYTNQAALANEPMMYGSYIFTPGSTGSITSNRQTIDDVQLAGFRMNPSLINVRREDYWLRDVASNSAFVVMGYSRGPGTANTSNNKGVRPVFGLIG